MASLNHRKYFHPPSNAFPTAILVRDYKKSDRKLFNAVRSAVNARNNKVVVATFISRYSCNPFEKPKVDENGQSAAKQTLRGSLLHFSYGKSATITCLRFASSRGNSTISRHESGMRRVRVDIQARKAGLLDPPDLDYSSSARPRRPKPSDTNLRSQTKSRRSVACSSFSFVFRRTRATMDQGRNTTSWHDFKATHPLSGTICHAPP